MNRKTIKFWMFGLVLGCMAVMFFDVNVSKADIEHFSVDDIKELELLDFMSDEVFNEKTQKFEGEPNGDPDLKYSVNIPKEWSNNNAKGTINNGTISNKVLTEVMRFSSPAHPEYPRNFFTVDAITLSYEIGIKNWFVNHTLINGLSLERLTLKGKRELEALYVEVRGEATYVVRTKAMINGNKIIIARYYVSSWLYEDEKVMQAQVMDSFKLDNIRNAPIEELETHGFLNQSFFDYPPSWNLQAKPVKSIKYMNASLEKNILKGKLDGKIDIKVYNKLSTPLRSTVIKAFRDDFSISGYKIGNLIEKPDFQKHNDMSFGMMQAYQLLPEVSNMFHYELWVSVLEGEDYIYLATLMTAARDEEFYIWARNIEGYKQVVASIRRHNKQGNVYDFLR